MAFFHRFFELILLFEEGAAEGTGVDGDEMTAILVRCCWEADAFGANVVSVNGSGMLSLTKIFCIEIYSVGARVVVGKLDRGDCAESRADQGRLRLRAS